MKQSYKPNIQNYNDFNGYDAETPHKDNWYKDFVPLVHADSLAICMKTMKHTNWYIRFVPAGTSSNHFVC